MPLKVFFIFHSSFYYVILADYRKLIKAKKSSSRKKVGNHLKSTYAELGHVRHSTLWPSWFSLRCTPHRLKWKFPLDVHTATPGERLYQEGLILPPDKSQRAIV